MPHFIRGNMLDKADGKILVTTNSFLRKDGSLVMGRGAAREAVKLQPGLDFILGTKISCLCGHLGEYNIIVPETNRFGAFQVKYKFMDRADMGLIARSCAKLAEIAISQRAVHWHVNFPGIGNGRLPKELVLPMLEKLPMNVFIWEL